MDMEKLIEKETNRYAKRFYQKLYKEGYTIVNGNYTSAKGFLRLTHISCGHEFSTYPNNFNNGRRCPECAKKNRSKKQRFSQDEFEGNVRDLVGKDYTVLGSYKNSRTRVKMRHNLCGHEWEVFPSSFTRKNSRCPRCSSDEAGKKRRKTNKDFVKRFNETTNRKNDYELLGPYKKSKSKIKLKHKKCGYVWSSYPDNIIKMKQGSCPRCAGNTKKSASQFREEVNTLVGKEFVVISDYTGANEKVKMVHSGCNGAFEVLASDFLTHHSCPRCAGFGRTNESFTQEVFNLVGEEYIFLEEFQGMLTPIYIKHNSDLCNSHQWKTAPSNFINGGTRCPKCAGNIKLTTSDFKKVVHDLVGEEYSVLNEYTNARTHIRMRHNNTTCDYFEWEVTPYSFTGLGTRCPRCAFSNGEKRVSNFLLEKKIENDTQKAFKGLKKINNLKYDFYLPAHNILIEYDGQHHFQPVDFAGRGRDWAEKQFTLTKSRDEIKNNYAINNNIPLIRIPYWEYDNIEYILDNVLTYFDIVDKQCSDLSIVKKYYVKDGWDHNKYLDQNSNNKQLQTV